ncbi:hypothetical protein ACDI16_22105, partial [Oceanobacillus caeni]
MTRCGQFDAYLETVVLHLIKAGIEQGEFRKADRPDMIAYGVLGIVNWSYNWYNP